MPTFELTKLSQPERYKLLVGSVVPRPIAWISSISSEGKGNLAPFSFFNAVCSNPASLMVSIARKADGSKKDTLRNIEQTGQFVVNSTSVQHLSQIVQSAVDYEYGINELEEVGLTASASTVVKPVRVKEAEISFECELYSSLKVGAGDVGSSTIVVGQILFIHIAEHVWINDRINIAELNPIARLGGASYSTAHEDLVRPIPART